MVPFNKLVKSGKCGECGEERCLVEISCNKDEGTEISGVQIHIDRVEDIAQFPGWRNVHNDSEGDCKFLR